MRVSTGLTLRGASHRASPEDVWFSLWFLPWWILTVSVEDFETPAAQPEVYQPTGSSTQQQQQQQPQYSAAPDYSGAGYSSGWDQVEQQMPRHHHPTRLSDVIEEEDERSRTSASQMSRN